MNAITLTSRKHTMPISRLNLRNVYFNMAMAEQDKPTLPATRAGSVYGRIMRVYAERYGNDAVPPKGADAAREIATALGLPMTKVAPPMTKIRKIVFGS